MAFINHLKTALLLALLSSLVLAIGFLIGGESGLTIAFILALVINLLSFFFSHKLVLWIYKAKPADKTKSPHLHSMVEELSKQANIPKPKIYIIPTDAPNAFATGPTYNRSVVAVTQGILSLLSKEELKGVLAHELGHIKNHDILISTIAATIATTISYLSSMAAFAAFGGDDDNQGSGNILVLILIWILAPIAAALIQLAISRAREYIADETAARLIKNPLPLADALARLESESKKKPLRLGTDSTNHMFIVNPFRGSGRVLANLFSTHPDIHERIRRLKSMRL